MYCKLAATLTCALGLALAACAEEPSCPPGYVRLGPATCGQARVTPTPRPTGETPTPAAGCPAAGCGAGRYCDLTLERCVDGCLDDQQCTPPEVCEDRRCVAGAPTPSPSAPTPTSSATPTPSGSGDREPPLIAYVHPDRSVIGGEVTLSAAVSDSGGVAFVRFLIDGARAGEVPLAPYNFPVDLRAWADGPHTVEVVTEDRAGNGARRSRAYTFDSTPPTVRILEPAGGTVPYQPVEVRVEAADANGVIAVEFRVNGELIGTAIEPPYGAFVDWRDFQHGQRLRIEIQAVDAAGNRTSPPAAVEVVFE